jgi:hypothetical protein
MIKLIKRKKEKSVEEILNGLSKKPIEIKKLEHFSKEFQPDVLKVMGVLNSSTTDTHIKVSEKMFELLKKKWGGVITTSTTLTILFEDENKRFREKVSEIMEKISIKQRKVNEDYYFFDINKVGLF